MNVSIESLSYASECEDNSCICFHKTKAGMLMIYIHAKNGNSRTLTVDRDNILNEGVIRFLNADAYDFIKKIEKLYEFQ